MSSTGIRKRRTTDDRTDDTLKQTEDRYIRKAKRYTDRGRQETGNAGPGAIGGPSIPGASYLPISGKYGMIGSISFNPITKAIIDGRINITPNQSGASKDSSYILVTGQGSPDDLRFIDGATKNGQIFWLQGTLTQIINLKAATISGIDSISGLLTVTVVTTSNHNLTTNDKVNIITTTNFNVNDVTVTVIDPTTFTYSAIGNIIPESAGFVQNGNFVTDTGDDVILDGTKSLNGVPMIPIIFDPTVPGNGAWRPAQLLSTEGSGDVSQWSTFDAVSIVDMAGFDIIDINRLIFDQGSVNQVGANETGITGDGANLRFNVPTGFRYIFGVNASVVDFPFVIEEDVIISQTIVPAGVDDIGSSINPWNQGFIGNITVGGAGDGIDTIGHLDFVDNLATPVSPLSIYSDGTDLFANTGGGVVNFSDIGGEVLLSDVTIDADKSWLGFNITDLGSMGSDAAIVPGSGFIRMGATDQVSWKNILQDDDLYIDAQRPTLGVTTQDAFAFTVASGVQMFIGEFDISVQDNDIINTGDVLPGGGSHEVGDSTDFYNQMHSQFFIPEGAAVILQRYGFAKTGNTIYVNFDDTNPDAGFSIYEEGFESFRFYHPTPTVNEFHIGSSAVFTSGETYAIQMGENGNASGRISFIEGVGNDVLITRGGSGIDQGVQINGGVRFLSDRIQYLKPIDMDAEDITNVVDIKSNGGGGATIGTIGEIITEDGGFDYYLRDKIFWESDPDTFIQFNGDGINIVSDDDISILAQGTGNDISVFCNISGQLDIGIFAIATLTINSGGMTFSGENVFLTNGSEYIGFLDAVAGASVATPAAGANNMFNNSDTGEMSVKKPNGSVVSLEGAGGGSQTPWLSDIDAGNFSLNNLNNISFAVTGSDIIVDSIGMIISTPSGDTIELQAGASTSMVLSSTQITVHKNIIPSSDNSFDLGSSSFQWDDLWVDGTANLDNLALLTGNTVSEISNDGNLTSNSSSALVTEQAIKTYVDNNSGDSQTPWISDIDGGNFQLTNVNNIESDFLQINSGAFFNGDVFLGNSTSDDISFIGEVISNIIPNADISFNLGSSSRRWDFIYAFELLADSDHSVFLSSSQVKITVNGSGDTFNIDDGFGARLMYDWSSDDFFPVDSALNLGGPSNRWVAVFALNGVIQTSFTKFKKNIIELDDSDCMGICNALPTIEYEWKDDIFDNARERKRDEHIDIKYVGFNADALSEMLPHAVKDDMIYQNAIIGILLGSVRHLQMRITELEGNVI